MGRHETGADDRLTITNGWVNSGYGEDTLLEETLGEGERFGLAADKDRNDRALGRADLESDRLEPFMHLAGVAPEHLNALRFRLHDFEGLEDSTDHGWSERGSEDEAAGLVLYELDHLMRTGDETTHGTERLGKGPHDDLDIVIDPKVMDHAAPLRSDHTE